MTYIGPNEEKVSWSCWAVKFWERFPMNTVLDTAVSVDISLVLFLFGLFMTRIEASFASFVLRVKLR